MIAACPTCGARYRIDPGKLGAEGARLRCSRCENVFRVRPPEASTAAEPARAAAAPAVARTPAAAAAPRPVAASATSEMRAPAREPSASARPAARAASATAAAPAVQAAAPAMLPRREGPATKPAAPATDPERLVLVAHPEPEAGKEIADALSRWGLQALLVHDGVEAILNIQRTLPRVVVLDAALPKMFGFQICELMKRNESLRSIQVVLVGAIHDQDRYRRPPGELYGADAYAERQTLPDALRPLLERFGLPLQPGGGTTPRRSDAAPAKEAAPAARPQATRPAAAPAPVAPAPTPKSAPSAAAPPDAALAQEQAQADRLARIIVSDIVLYNPEKFESGLRSGKLVESLEAELAEGRALFAQRIDPRVGSPDAFLERELLRVARTRSEG
jgi:predicted Zn finger-like uncharacterized protein